MGMYSLATGLSTFNNRSAIKVRVIRSYVVREKKGSAQIKSQELVLHDPESNKPLKQITELAGKTLLFQITAKSDHTSYRNTPFPVLRINNDPHIIKEHCSQLLKLEENACNSNMQMSLGDDDFMEINSAAYLLNHLMEVLSASKKTTTVNENVGLSKWSIILKGLQQLRVTKD
nr:putative transposase [Ipomoea batatas]